MTGLVCVKLRMSHVSPKRIGINLLHKTKHWRKKAFSLIKEPRQKSHLIHLAFPFPLTQLVCRCRAAWQKLWTFGKGSHYWKSLTHTSPGMLLMSWKAGTLAITPNNQIFKHLGQIFCKICTEGHTLSKECYRDILLLISIEWYKWMHLEGYFPIW